MMSAAGFCDIRLIPYAASAERYSNILAQILFGAPPLPLLKKEMTRTVIPTADGNSSLTLSVPVEGGNRILRPLYSGDAAQIDPSEIILSEHDNWRRKHIEAFKASFSSAPYFIHYAPEIIHVIEKSASLADLTRGVHQAITSVITPQLITQANALASDDENKWALMRRERLQRLENQHARFIAQHSALSLIFHLGREAIFILLPR